MAKWLQVAGFQRGWRQRLDMGTVSRKPLAITGITVVLQAVGVFELWCSSPGRWVINNGFEGTRWQCIEHLRQVDAMWRLGMPTHPG